MRFVATALAPAMVATALAAPIVAPITLPAKAVVGLDYSLMAALDPLPVPPIGSVITQIVSNQISSGLALLPIIVGSDQQCTVCIGPTAITPGGFVSGFTGWGAVGITKGIINAPNAFESKLASGGTVGEAVGNALASILYPIANTFTLISAPRTPFGGADVSNALARTQTVLRDFTIGVQGLAVQGLVTGPVNLAFGTVAGSTLFVTTLTQGGTIVNAVNAARVPIRKALDENQEAFSTKFNDMRRALYNDVNTEPKVAVNPIPTLPVSSSASVKPAAAKASVKTRSVATRKARNGK